MNSDFMQFLSDRRLSVQFRPVMGQRVLVHGEFLVAHDVAQVEAVLADMRGIEVRVAGMDRVSATGADSAEAIRGLVELLNSEIPAEIYVRGHDPRHFRIADETDPKTAVRALMEAGHRKSVAGP